MKSVLAPKDLKELKELYEKARKKEELLRNEGYRLIRESKEVRGLMWRLAYWIGKKKAQKCKCFQRLSSTTGKCKIYGYPWTLQFLFRYHCSECELTDKEKPLKILERNLKKKGRYL